MLVTLMESFMTFHVIARRAFMKRVALVKSHAEYKNVISHFCVYCRTKAFYLQYPSRQLTPSPCIFKTWLAVHM